MRADRIRGWVGPIFLVLCVLLGGASGRTAGIPGNALLQALSVLAILYCIWTRRSAPFGADARPMLLMGGLWLLLALLYLVPLPYGIWTALPGREPIARAFEMLGMPQPSLATSLSPNNSINSILALLPATAMFLLTLQLTLGHRRRLVRVLVATALVSVCLGIAQLASGETSPLRFYAVTSPGMGVGFFANGNHHATMILVAITFTGFLVARAAAKPKNSHRARAAMFMGAMSAIFLALGIVVVGSTAGFGLLVPVALGAFLLYRRAIFGKVGALWAGAAGLLLAGALLFAFLGPYFQQDLSDQLGGDPTSRKVIAATTTELIGAHFPVGTGLGTFADIYRTTEDPLRPATSFVNRAHNDYLEVALETGLPGILLILAFLAWFARTAVRAWRNQAEGGNLARAATLAIAVVLVHSLVEYPLRASAIAAVFAMSCALLLPPRLRQSRARSRSAAPASEMRHMEAD